MSDLMCAARLVVARHGDASYVESYFSDEGGSLTPEGRAQALALATALAGERVAHVWTSDTSRAVQTAEIAAARLGDRDVVGQLRTSEGPAGQYGVTVIVLDQQNLGVARPLAELRHN